MYKHTYIKTISYHIIQNMLPQIIPFAFSIIHALIVFTNMAKSDANHKSSWSLGRTGGWRRWYGLQSEAQDRRRRRNTFDILFYIIFLAGRVKYFFVQFSLKIVSDSTCNLIVHCIFAMTYILIWHEQNWKYFVVQFALLKNTFLFSMLWSLLTSKIICGKIIFSWKFRSKNVH